MVSRKKELENRIGFLAFSAIQRSYNKKSPHDAERSGVKLARLLYRLDKKHRIRTISNLELAFPEMPADERLQLSRRCFEHFGRIFADFMRAKTRTAEELEKTCALVDFHHFDEA